MKCECFAPIARPDAHLLIVGSMPSVKSLADAQYYAHPRNAFWPIMFDILGETPTSDYDAKKAMLVRHGIALWDVVAACEREGSLDSNMKDIVYNDFAGLFAMCPGIQTVLCNGGAAHAMFAKSGFGAGKTVVRMPSTSPAYTMKYEDKREAWRQAVARALGMERSTREALI